MLCPHSPSTKSSVSQNSSNLNLRDIKPFKQTDFVLPYINQQPATDSPRGKRSLQNSKRQSHLPHSTRRVYAKNRRMQKSPIISDKAKTNVTPRSFIVSSRRRTVALGAEIEEKDTATVAVLDGTNVAFDRSYRVWRCRPGWLRNMVSLARGTKRLC